MKTIFFATLGLGIAATAMASGPKAFLGTYQGTGLAYKAVGLVDVENGKIRIDVCTGDETLSEMSMKLDFHDPVEKRIIFKEMDGAPTRLDIEYKGDWAELEGVFLRTSPSGPRPRIKMVSKPEAADRGCATPLN